MLSRLDIPRTEESECGATAVEYSLMVMLIALVIIGAVTSIGGGLTAIFFDAASKV